MLLKNRKKNLKFNNLNQTNLKKIIKNFQLHLFKIKTINLV